MRGARAAAAAVLLVALTGATHARASAASDAANQGLSALQGGDYDQAIALFTRALRPGGLRGADREFGLASRGKAYLAKGDLSAAIADLDAARRLKPDDADAQTDLQTALSTRLPPTAIPGAPAAFVLGQFGKALLAGVGANLRQDEAPASTGQGPD